MVKKFKSLLEYKKHIKDWHYDPSIKSKDCKFIGRITNLNFKKFKNKLIDKKSESSVKLYDDDFKKGRIIPTQLSPNSIGASKLDHIKYGYNDYNSRYYQWIDNRDKMPKEFQKIKKFSGLDFATVACFRQDPGNTNPWHFDTYSSALKIAGLEDKDLKKIKRYLLFLEDWDWGHILQIGNNVLSNWKAGDLYTWDAGLYHLSSNCGISPKWTCQITGVITKKSIHRLKSKKFSI